MNCKEYRFADPRRYAIHLLNLLPEWSFKAIALVQGYYSKRAWRSSRPRLPRDSQPTECRGSYFSLSHNILLILRRSWATIFKHPLNSKISLEKKWLPYKARMNYRPTMRCGQTTMTPWRYAKPLCNVFQTSYIQQAPIHNADGGSTVEDASSDFHSSETAIQLLSGARQRLFDDTESSILVLTYYSDSIHSIHSFFVAKNTYQKCHQPKESV